MSVFPRMTGQKTDALQPPMHVQLRAGDQSGQVSCIVRGTLSLRYWPTGPAGLHTAYILSLKIHRKFFFQVGSVFPYWLSLCEFVGLKKINQRHHVFSDLKSDINTYKSPILPLPRGSDPLHSQNFKIKLQVDLEPVIWRDDRIAADSIVCFRVL